MLYTISELRYPQIITTIPWIYIKQNMTNNNIVIVKASSLFDTYVKHQ